MKKIFKSTALPALITLLVLIALLFSACAPATVVDAEGSDDGSGVLLTSKDEVTALKPAVQKGLFIQTTV